MADNPSKMGERLDDADIALYTTDYILAKALDIGENILKCGGESRRIEDTVKRICTAYGAECTDVFSLPSTIIAGIKTEDGRTATQIRRVYGTSNNMYRLELFNDISRKVCEGKISLDDVDEYIKKASNAWPFNKYIPLLGGVIAAFAYAVFFGGEIIDGVAAGVAGFVVSLFNMRKLKFGNQMVNTVLLAFIGAIVGQISVLLGLGNNIDKVMIGTIMLLIPGLAFGNAVRDMLFGDTVSGIIQFVQAILIALMVAFGFIVAIMVFGGIRQWIL